MSKDGKITRKSMTSYLLHVGVIVAHVLVLEAWNKMKNIHEIENGERKKR